jgi:hypothetical protein
MTTQVMMIPNWSDTPIGHIFGRPVETTSSPNTNGAALTSIRRDQGDPLDRGQLDPLDHHGGLYRGGSDQWFVTYELGLDDSEEGSCPQVTRVYLSGDLRRWELGVFQTRSGAQVQGVKIEYERTHESYRSRDDETEYETPHETSCRHCFAKIIEIPTGAVDIKLRSALPDRYRHALHRF